MCKPVRFLPIATPYVTICLTPHHWTEIDAEKASLKAKEVFYTMITNSLFIIAQLGFGTASTISLLLKCSYLCICLLVIEVSDTF